MRRRMSLPLASIMTVVSVGAGVAPAHAAPKPAEGGIGWAYLRTGFQGDSIRLESGADCKTIRFLLEPLVVTSALNTSTSRTITLYAIWFPFIGCTKEVAVLEPGERDSGYIPGTNILNELGRTGAQFYSST